MFNVKLGWRGKILKIAGLALLGLMSLCASAQIRVFELSDVPQTIDPEDGAVVMSLSFSQLFDSTESVSLQFRPVGELPDITNMGSRPQPIMRIARVGGGLGLMRRDNMNLLTLQGRPATLLIFIGKPGDYEFFHAQAFGFPDLGAVDSTIAIPLKLVAGQTRYVGNLHLHAVGAGLKNNVANTRHTPLAGARSYPTAFYSQQMPGFGLGSALLGAAAKLNRPLRLDYVWIDEFKRDMAAVEALSPSWRSRISNRVELSEIDADHQQRLAELKNSPAGRGRDESLLMLALRGYTLDVAGRLVLGPADRNLAIELIQKLGGQDISPEVATLLLPYVGAQGTFARYVKEEALRLGFAPDTTALYARYVLKAAQVYDNEALSLIRDIAATAQLSEKDSALWRDRQAQLNKRVSLDPQGWGFSDTADLASQIAKVPTASFSAVALDDRARPYLAIEPSRISAINNALAKCQQVGNRCVLQVFNSAPVLPSCSNIGASVADKQYFLSTVDALATVDALVANGVDAATGKRFVEGGPPRALVRDTDSGKHFIIFRHCRATTVAVNQCYASGAKSCEIIAVDDAIVRSKAPAPPAVSAAAQ